MNFGEKMKSGQKKGPHEFDSVTVGAEGFLSDEEEQLAKAAARIETFISSRVADADAHGAVVAMSGGIDSTVTAALAAEALGSHRVLGVGLPCNRQDSHHMTDARTIADAFGIEFREVRLQPLLDLFEDVVAPQLSPRGSRKAIGNVLARLRMAAVYYAANTRSKLVMGTTNRSERLLGYFTKYGDGAADLYPIGDLYKTEVRALAYHLGLPRRIIHKEPTAGLWAGQTDADDLGAPYGVIDEVLRRFIDDDESFDTVTKATGIPDSTAKELLERYQDSGHKRSCPPTPEIANRSQ